jgi:hypothetical protein
MLEFVDEKYIKIKLKLVEHHIKYKEIHGEDKTTFMSPGEHVRLHRRLRREEKCNIPSEELCKISIKANHRTEKYLKKYPRKPREIGKKKMMREIDRRVKERVLNIKMRR